MLSAKALAAAVSTVPAYIEDVFSTYLYTGNGSTQTITNGIDLAGSGGLVWTKSRSDASYHKWYDSARGILYAIESNTTDGNQSEPTGITSFNSNGYTYGSDGNTNSTGSNYASWTFRKQAKFFDVVTFTTTGASTQTINHNLGSAPGCIIVKDTANAGTSWVVYHRAIDASAPQDYRIFLNLTNARSADNAWGNTAPTSTQFTVGGSTSGTASTYVAYLFAHNAGGFGLSGTDNVISCGSYTGNGLQPGPTITLGYEPQYVLIKAASTTGSWYIFDNMRGMTSNLAGANTNTLNANTSNAENAGSDGIAPTATGFTLTSASTVLNGSGSDYIYIAIRRGPMKVPTSGTSVYTTRAATEVEYNNTADCGITADLLLNRYYKDGSQYTMPFDRLRGSSKILYTPLTDAEGSLTLGAGNLGFGASQTGVTWAQIANSSVSNVTWAFRRAPGFFDVVCYTGDGVNGRTITHNLAAAPELLIAKKRDGGLARAWFVYSALTGPSEYLRLNSTGATTSSGTFPWNSTSPTSSVFTVTNDDEVNGSGNTYVAYLFATCAGVSKVGSYTGTGTTQQINCGFTGGARFVLIKRTDSAGDWYVWDSARGIVAGNDPYLLLNSTAAEVTNTDYVDTYSAGFEISSTAPAAINASSGSFIFLAIA